MWIVTLHHDNGHGKLTYQEICGCASEEAAHSAGSLAAAYYNNDLNNDTRAGVIVCNFLPRNNYAYSIKEHKGEWSRKYVVYVKDEGYDMYFTGTDWGPGYFNQIGGAYRFDTYNEALFVKEWLEKDLVMYQEHFIKGVH